MHHDAKTLQPPHRDPQLCAGNDAISCPHCDEPRASDDRFCADCGSSLAAEAAQAAPELPGAPADVVTPPVGSTSMPSAPDAAGITCSCGQDLPPDARFCLACGIPLVAPVRRDRLVVRPDTCQAATYVLAEENVVIGTGPDCGIVITGDAYVSRCHARMSASEDGWLVEDAGSSNGTLFRVRRPMALEPGDEIVVGTTVVRFERAT